MKCRERNNEKTVLKVEKTEEFWSKLKKIGAQIINFNEKGIIVNNGISKEFVEYGDYIVVSHDNYITYCNKGDFNRIYEVIDDVTEESSSRCFILGKDMQKYDEINSQQCSGLKEVYVEINRINSKIESVEKSLKDVILKKTDVDIKETINKLSKNLEESLKMANSFFNRQNKSHTY